MPFGKNCPALIARPGQFLRAEIKGLFVTLGEEQIRGAARVIDVIYRSVYVGQTEQRAISRWNSGVIQERLVDLSAIRTGLHPEAIVSVDGENVTRQGRSGCPLA